MSYLEAFGLRRELLPNLSWSGAAAGTVLPAVAERLGLRPDTVVAVGGQDQKSAALGAGIAEHTATVSLGTASAIVQLMQAPLTDPEQRIPTFAFVSARALGARRRRRHCRRQPALVP